MEREAAEVAEVLVANHRAFLGFLEKRVGSRALAEDILQEAFVRSMQKADTVRDREAIVPWFYRMLRNAIVDHHRRHASQSRALESLASEVDAHAPDLEETVCQCVKSLAATLKPEYEHAIRRIDVDGLAVKDYADEAGITANNAAVRVFRAREALKKSVQRSCGTCATHGCLDCTCGAP